MLCVSALQSYCICMQANSVNLDINRVKAYRHWCNKLWNAVRFALMNLGEGFQPSLSSTSPAGLPFACRWILSRLNAAIEATVTAFSTYAFSAVTQVSARSSLTMSLCHLPLHDAK